MQASTVTVFFWLDNEHTEQFKYQSSQQKWMPIVSTKQYASPSHALASILGQWNDVLGGPPSAAKITKMSMIGTNKVHELSKYGSFAIVTTQLCWRISLLKQKS
jgi:hypothetical protein